MKSYKGVKVANDSKKHKVIKHECRNGILFLFNF